MSETRISSRSFNQATSAAKKAARRGPVFITERGRPAHVLLTYEAYELLKRRDDRTILDMLACSEAAGIDFEAPKASLKARDVDLS